MKQRVLESMLAVVFTVIILTPSLAQKTTTAKIDGERIFKQNCASCHAGGGNRVNPKSPVAGSKELATIGKFKSYLSAPPGHMPFYQHVVDDKAVLEALYNYCKSLKKPIKQADNGRLPSS